MQADRSLARERRSREAIEMELAKFREYCQSQVFKRRFFYILANFYRYSLSLTSQEIEIQFIKSLLNKHGICLDYTEKPVMHSTVDVVADIHKVSAPFSVRPKCYFTLL